MSTRSQEYALEYRSWYIVITLTVVREGQCISGHADLHDGADHRCRLVLASVHSDPAEMLRQLEIKAKAYIDDWPHRARPNSIASDGP